MELTCKYVLAPPTVLCLKDFSVNRFWPNLIKTKSMLFLACCEEQRVIPMCRSYLCTGELISMEPGTDLLPCYSDIDKVFQCISGIPFN